MSTWPGRWSGSAVLARGPGFLLMLGRDDQDPLFLQAKEAEESVLEGFVQRPPPGQAPRSTGA
jgi:hypothetical protein